MTCAEHIDTPDIDHSHALQITVASKGAPYEESWPYDTTIILRRCNMSPQHIIMKVVQLLMLSFLISQATSGEISAQEVRSLMGIFEDEKSAHEMAISLREKYVHYKCDITGTIHSVTYGSSMCSFSLKEDAFSLPDKTERYHSYRVRNEVMVPECRESDSLRLLGEIAEIEVRRVKYGAERNKVCWHVVPEVIIERITREAHGERPVLSRLGVGVWGSIQNANLPIDVLREKYLGQRLLASKEIVGGLQMLADGSWSGSLDKAKLRQLPKADPSPVPVFLSIPAKVMETWVARVPQVTTNDRQWACMNYSGHVSDLQMGLYGDSPYVIVTITVTEITALESPFR
jgi:hypothetical protein